MNVKLIVFKLSIVAAFASAVIAPSVSEGVAGRRPSGLSGPQLGGIKGASKKWTEREQRTCDHHTHLDFSTSYDQATRDTVKDLVYECDGGNVVAGKACMACSKTAKHYIITPGGGEGFDFNPGDCGSFKKCTCKNVNKGDGMGPQPTCHDLTVVPNYQCSAPQVRSDQLILTDPSDPGVDD